MKATLLLFASGRLFMQPIVDQQFKFGVDVSFANESEPTGSNRFNLGSCTGRAYFTEPSKILHIKAQVSS